MEEGYCYDIKDKGIDPPWDEDKERKFMDTPYPAEPLKALYSKLAKRGGQIPDLQIKMVQDAQIERQENKNIKVSEDCQNLFKYCQQAKTYQQLIDNDKMHTIVVCCSINIFQIIYNMKYTIIGNGVSNVGASSANTLNIQDHYAFLTRNTILTFAQLFFAADNYFITGNFVRRSLHLLLGLYLAQIFLSSISVNIANSVSTVQIFLTLLLVLYVVLSVKLVHDSKKPQRMQIGGYFQNAIQLVTYVMMIYLCLCSLARVSTASNGTASNGTASNGVLNKIINSITKIIPSSWAL